MAKSVIVCGVILSLVFAISVTSARYVRATCDMVLSILEDEGRPLGERFEDAHKIWEERKDLLMFVSNHKDIESVSLSLIRGRESARFGGEHTAGAELETALFLIREFAEKEKLTAENVV